MPVESTYEGLRVLEFTTTIAGPFCGMVLGELGADVVKVERPGRGDDARAMPPHSGGVSAVFHAVNRNKRSLVLDVKDPDGRSAFLRLAEKADVVVQSFRPGAAEALGIGYAEVSARNPAVVYCSVSAFGTTGAAAGMPGYDPLLQAFSGLMSMTGEPEGQPVRVAASLIDLTTGMWAAMAVMAALTRRARTGRGELVEATLVDSAYTLLCHQIVGMHATGEVPGPLGSASPITAPYEVFGTADGWLMIAAGNDSLFVRLCHAIGAEHLVADERYATAAARVTHRDALHEAIERRLAGRNRDEWMTLLTAAGVPAGPVHDLDQAVSHPLVAERGLVVPAEDGGLPHVRLPLTPVPGRTPPRHGEHSAEVLREAGFSAEEIRRLLRPPAR